MTRHACTLAMRRLVLLLAAASSTACRAPREHVQTIVILDAEPGIREAVSQLTVNVTSLTDTLQHTSMPAATWPIRLVYAPKDDDISRRFAIAVIASDGQQVQQLSFRVSTGFPNDGPGYLKVTVRDSCGHDNKSPERCTTQDCNDFHVAAQRLGASEQSATVQDITCIMPSVGSIAGTGDDTTMATGGMGGQAGEAGEGPLVNMNEMSNAGSGIMTDAGSGRAGQAGQAGASVIDTPCTASTCVNFCELPRCGDNSIKCVNYPDRYKCDCKEGFVFNDATCVDKDECAENNGDCAGTCSNEYGGYKCGCGAREWLKEDKKSCGKVAPMQQLNVTSSMFPPDPQVAFTPDGRGLAIWTSANTTEMTLWTSRYTPGPGQGQGWSKATVLEGVVAPVLAFPRVALDSTGAGLLVWTQGMVVGSLQLRSARYKDGVFDNIRSVPGTENGSASYPYIAFDGSGDGIVVWTSTATGLVQVWGNRWINRMAAFSTATLIAGGPSSIAFWAKSALQSTGPGYTVWSESDITDGAAQLDTGKPWYRYYTPPSTVGAAVQLDSALAVAPDVSLAADGSGIVVWQRSTDAGFVLMGSRIEPGKPPATAKSLSTTGSVKPCIAPRVAVGTSGSAVAMWTQIEGSVRSIWGTAVGSSTAEWTPAAKLSSVNSVDVDNELAVDSTADLALDPAGYGFGTWADFPSTTQRIVSLSHVSATKGFDALIALSTDASPPYTSHVQVAVDGKGDGAAIWDSQTAPSKWDVWITRLE